jgi:ubiquinone/menaquinone biosynthesis C-methylase UbiE
MLAIDKERNRRLWNRVAAEYLLSDLTAAERELLIHLRDRLTSVRMLDIGVGAGRTAFTFSALVKRYVGVDNAEDMLDLCRERFGETDSRQFLLRDATSMPDLPSGEFDVVLFSLNGIDYVDVENRSLILREAKRLLAPRGVFFVSSHSLSCLPDDWGDAKLPRFRLTHPESAFDIARKAVYLRRRAWANRHLNLNTARKRGYAYVQDGIHSFGAVTFYGTFDYQLHELSAHGFETFATYGHEGREIPMDAEPCEISISYLCRHA